LPVVLVASGVLHPFLMVLATFLGTIVGDGLLFWLGRGLATKLTTWAYFSRWLPSQKIVKGGDSLPATATPPSFWLALFLAAATIHASGTNQP
jgi:hypothetical protein